MKWTSLGCFLVIITILLEGCGGNAKTTSPQDIAKQAYQWEKASFDNDYKKEQSLLYQKGSYKADEGKKKINSGLKYNDIQFEIYLDKKLDYYYVLTNFKNPYGENMVKDNLLFRKKDDEWKLDQNRSLDISRDDVINKFERETCIHCK